VLETRSDIISRLLTSTVQELDIPPALRAAATAEYQRVGEWLASHADAADGWIVHPQGSFLLNTVVLPSLGDEYDVDTVCGRALKKHETTQARLKQEVGKSVELYRALQEGPDGPRALKERNRCWTLLYPSRLRFHLDVLPAIPNPEGGPSAILITDKELRNWQFSDPLAYADWFKAQSEVEFVQKRMVLAEAARTPPQAIPDWQVKTTLHRVVQVLKAHRNEYFRDELDMRPASILLTTLAGHAYRGDQVLMDAVLEAVELMPDYIKDTDDGPQVLNPVEPRENFADRWRAKPVLEKRFHEWLEKFAEDVREASSQHGLQKVAVRLSESFGEQPVQKAMEGLGETYKSTREHGGLAFAAGTGVLSGAGELRVRNHGFFGYGG
jgi:hypothetical protein